MALNKQGIPIPISGGLETKLDPKQEEIGFFTKVENVVFETVKQLTKRNGYDLIPLQEINGTDIEAAKKLARFKDELVLLSNNSLFSFSDTLNTFVNRGTIYDVDTEEDFVHKDSSSQTDLDSLAVDDLRIYCWEDALGGVYYSVQDLTKNNFLVSNVQISATGENPVLGNIGSDVYIIYGDGADVNFRRFSTVNPVDIDAEVTVNSTRDLTDGLIDAESCGTKVIVAFNGASTLSVFSIESNGSPSSVIGILGESAPNALDLTCDNQERVVITYSDGTDVKYTVYPLTLITTPLLAPTSIETIADVSTCCSIDVEPGVYKVFYEVSVAGNTNNYVKQADATLAGSVTGNAVFKRGVGLSSRAFEHNETVFVPLVHESSLQSTYFLADGDGYIVTKWSNQTAAGVVDFGVLPEFNAISGDRLFTAFLVRNRLRGDNGTFFSTTGVASVIIDFSPVDSYSYAELANNLHICSGILRVYDGATVSEHGFHVFPETLEQDSTATTGGFMSDGNYAYVATYRWTDNFGQDHRSAPTVVPVETILSGGTATQTNTIAVPTLRLTDKSSVVIELYRTEDNGQSYYLITDPLAPVQNDETVDSVNIIDTVSDTDLIDNELLYTTGGVLENVPAPACSQVTVFGSRLATSQKGNNRVFFSKEIGEGRPVEFTDIIYRDVDPVGGPITALKAMDEKLVIFEADACFYMAGDGPNNLGAQDSFTTPEILTSDIGTISPQSVLLTPTGIMFQSRKGIWQLGRGLDMQYTGAKAEGFNEQTISSAQIVGELNQVRFLTTDERALVYNYNLDRWATFENHGGISSVTIENDYFYIREDGTLFKENRTSFGDNASPIKMRIESGWMNVAGLQNFQRVYHALILASFKSNHKLRIKVAYDFKEAWVQEEIVNPLDFVTANTYGSDATYGASTTYGGNGALYQFRLNLAIQKCQSIKICIEDLQDEVGEGLSLSGITFQVGVKQGTNKLPAANKFTTEN